MVFDGDSGSNLPLCSLSGHWQFSHLVLRKALGEWWRMVGIIQTLGQIEHTWSSQFLTRLFLLKREMNTHTSCQWTCWRCYRLQQYPYPYPMKSISLSYHLWAFECWMIRVRHADSCNWVVQTTWASQHQSIEFQPTSGCFLNHPSHWFLYFIETVVCFRI